MAESLKHITIESLARTLPAEVISELAQACVTRVYTVHDRDYALISYGGSQITFRGVFSSRAKANEIPITDRAERFIVEHILDSADLRRIYVYNPHVIPSYLTTDEKKIPPTRGPLTVIGIDEVCHLPLGF